MKRNFQKILTSSDILSYFEENEDEDITPLDFPIFELDIDGNLTPTIDGTYDPFFEINLANEITPKI